MSDTRRVGIPLSIKLIVSTAVLLALAVGAAGFLAVRTIDQVARREAAARREAGEAAIRREAELLARNLATSAAFPLAEGGYTTLDSLVRAARAEDARIEWILIADAVTGRVVSRIGDAPPGEVRGDPLWARTEEGAGRVISERDPARATRLFFAARVQVGERPVGHLRMAISTEELEAALAASVEAAHDRARASARRTALIAGLILLVGVVLGAAQGLRIARPLHLLSEQAAAIAGGQLDRRVEVASRDEIGTLAYNFNVMAASLGELLRQRAETASLEREMALARGVQEAMIPRPVLVEHGALRVIGHCTPASLCGGDWWTLRALSGDRLLLVVGDVTGHGVPAAMIAASARGAVEALAEADERLLEPERVLKAMDRAIRNLGEHSLHMTCYAALFDGRRGTLDWANAGHTFPFILHPGEGRVEVDTSVSARSGPLGDELLLQSGRRRLAPGEVIVCYTDGLIERTDPNGKPFGARRLREVLRGGIARGDELSLPDLRDEVLRHVEQFAAGRPADDDVTVVLCQYLPPAVAGRAAAGA